MHLMNLFSINSNFIFPVVEYMTVLKINKNVKKKTFYQLDAWKQIPTSN